MALILRDYQEKGKADIKAVFRERVKRVLYCLFVAGGKTAIFGSICQGLSLKKKKALIMVHRKELLNQASNMLNYLGVEHSKVIRGKIPTNLKDVVVGSVQTIVRRLDNRLPKFDLIIIDECHLSESASYRKVLQYYLEAYVIGVSATPIRLDGRGLKNTYDRLLLGPSPMQLMNEGYLSPYIAYGPKNKVHTEHLELVRGDYDPEELEQIFGQAHVIGDAVAAYKKYADGKPAIAFCVSIKHAMTVADKFTAAGYRATHIDGTMTDIQRASIVSGLADGTWQVVTSCSLFIEGLDIPAAAVAILLRPSKSLAMFIQMCGRVLRPVYAPGYPINDAISRHKAIADGTKPFAIILDHANMILEHDGFPDDDREWTLEGKKKRKLKQEEKIIIRSKQCPECYAIHKPSADCPRCGFVYPLMGRIPDTMDGELEKLDKSIVQKHKKVMRQEVGMAKTEDELRAIAKKRGYRAGWVHYMMKIRKQQQKGDRL